MNGPEVSSRQKPDIPDKCCPTYSFLKNCSCRAAQISRQITRQNPTKNPTDPRACRPNRELSLVAAASPDDRFSGDRPGQLPRNSQNPQMSEALEQQGKTATPASLTTYLLISKNLRATVARRIRMEPRRLSVGPADPPALRRRAPLNILRILRMPKSRADHPAGRCSGTTSALFRLQEANEILRYILLTTDNTGCY